jgi:hypothetical protein
MDDKSNCPLTNDPELRAAATDLTESIKKGFPKGLAQPALRALAAAGYARLEQLTVVREKDLAAMHGMGPKAIAILKSALSERGLALRP